MKNYPSRLQHPSGAWMNLEHDRALVELDAEASASAGASAADNAASILGRLGLVEEEAGRPSAVAPSGRPLQPLNHTANRRWARSKTGAGVTAEAAAAQGEDGVSWIGPVYRMDLDGQTEYLSLIPNVLLIAAAPGAEAKSLAKMAKSFGLVRDEARSEYLGAYDCYTVQSPAKASALELIDAIAAEDLVRDVRYETMPMYVPTSFVPNDPLYPQQWGMEQIQAGGAGQTAWNLQQGSAAVSVCVLDTGCDLTHPDLTYSGSGINLGTMSGDGSPTGDHGTACAGIAAATLNSSEGVAGLAGGCEILPVAFQSWTDVEVAAGIRFAANNGARVISMSFGWNPWDPAVIDPAIQDAFDLNVVMCVATHNHNASITYPATNPLVIACGASDQADERKSPSSPDGESWGSNFGPEIDVVAPGVLIPTTDRQGSAGYNPSGGAAGNYTLTFNGTSSATPHVAGLAALIISCDGSLSNVEVRDIIETTADKTGSVAYANVAGHPAGTWNQEMGYGRINAFRALQTVCKRFPIELKRLIFDKIPLEVFKRQIKEKEGIDEVKNSVGFEVPEIFDPRIFEQLFERIDRLEKVIERGQPFINQGERPEVGRSLSRDAKPTRR